ncbi:hypothetical protein BKA93DRAFT_820954 [Sparassis latifolia]
MLKDEDDPDCLPTDPKQYISRAPGYRSDLVKQLYQDIDAIADPDPDKVRAAVARVRGEEKVRVDLLQENPHWFTNERVAISGHKWGDTEDPEDSELKRKNVETAEKQGRKQLRMVDNSAVTDAQLCFAALTNGEDVECLFMNMG